MACGVAPVLGSLEIIPYKLTPGTPVWVGIAAGFVFVLAGAALINGYVFGGGEDFESRATRGVYRVQQLLGFTICALFVAIAGWIGFGPGEREFMSSISLPSWQSQGRGSPNIGRVVFGAGAIMCAGIGMVALVAAFRKRR